MSEHTGPDVETSRARGVAQTRQGSRARRWSWHRRINSAAADPRIVEELSVIAERRLAERSTRA